MTIASFEFKMTYPRNHRRIKNLVVFFKIKLFYSLLLSTYTFSFRTIYIANRTLILENRIWNVEMHLSKLEGINWNYVSGISIEFLGGIQQVKRGWTDDRSCVVRSVLCHTHFLYGTVRTYGITTFYSNLSTGVRYRNFLKILLALWYDRNLTCTYVRISYYQKISTYKLVQ